MCVVYMVYNGKNRENEVRGNIHGESATLLRGMAIAMNGFAEEHYIDGAVEQSGESYETYLKRARNLAEKIKSILEKKGRRMFILPEAIKTEQQAGYVRDYLQDKIFDVIRCQEELKTLGELIKQEHGPNLIDAAFADTLSSNQHDQAFDLAENLPALFDKLQTRLSTLLRKMRDTMMVVSTTYSSSYTPDHSAHYSPAAEKVSKRKPTTTRLRYALDRIRDNFRLNGDLKNGAVVAAGLPTLFTPGIVDITANSVQEVIAKEVCADPAVSAEVAMALENVNQVFGSEIDVDVLFNWCEQQVGDMGLHTMRANHERELQNRPEKGGFSDLLLLQEHTISADSVDYQNIEKATPPEIWNDTENNVQYLLHYYLDAYQEGDQIIISGIPAFEDENLTQDATTIVNSIGQHIVEGRLALEDVSKHSIAMSIDRTNPNKPTVTLVWSVGTEFSFDHNGSNQLMTAGSLIAFDANGGDHFVSTAESTGPFRNSKAEVRDVRDLRAVLSPEIAAQLPASGKTLVLTSENNVLLKIITSDTAISLVEPQLINSKSAQAINIRITPEVAQAPPIGKIEPDQSVKVVPASTFEAIQSSLPAGFTIEVNTDLNFIFARTADKTDFWVLVEFTNENGETLQGWALNSLLELQLVAPEAAPAPAINESEATPEAAPEPPEVTADALGSWNMLERKGAPNPAFDELVSQNPNFIFRTQWDNIAVDFSGADKTLAATPALFGMSEGPTIDRVYLFPDSRILDQLFINYNGLFASTDGVADIQVVVPGTNGNKATVENFQFTLANAPNILIKIKDYDDFTQDFGLLSVDYDKLESAMLTIDGGSQDYKVLFVKKDDKIEIHFYWIGNAGIPMKSVSELCVSLIYRMFSGVPLNDAQIQSTFEVADYGEGEPIYAFWFANEFDAYEYKQNNMSYPPAPPR